jgi:hypothetical protein
LVSNLDAVEAPDVEQDKGPLRALCRSLNLMGQVPGAAAVHDEGEGQVARRVDGLVG